MKYTLSTMIVVGLAGFANVGFAQAPAQSSTVTIKSSTTPVVVALPEKPVERVTQKVAAPNPKGSAATATPDVLVRPALPKAEAKPAPAQVAPKPMIGTAEQNQKQ